MKKLKREQFGVLTAPYLHQTLEYALDSIAGNDFQYVELWAASPHYCIDDYPTPQEREKRVKSIRCMLDARGLKSSIFHPEQCRQYPYNIASPIKHIRDFSIRDMKIYLEDALILGTDKMILAPGWEFIDKSGEENFKRSVEAIQIIDERARELGVTLYLEEMEAKHSLFVKDLSGLRKLLEAVDSENVKPAFDQFVVTSNKETFMDYIETFGAIDVLHISDQNQEGYTALGDGEEDLWAFLRELANMEYTGILSVSLWGGGFYKDPDAQMRKTADWIRHCPIID